MTLGTTKAARTPRMTTTIIALLRALNQCKTLLDELHHPDGYNIGINQGVAGGQSVPHLHIHVIPRYLGDKADPKGGVRWVLPEKAKYWA